VGGHDTRLRSEQESQQNQRSTNTTPAPVLGLRTASYCTENEGTPTWLGLPFFGLLGFVGAVIGSLWLLLSIWRSGGRE
jgi:hypothetical protein